MEYIHIFKVLSLVLLSLGLSYFENSVDPDQLALGEAI